MLKILCNPNGIKLSLHSWVHQATCTLHPLQLYSTSAQPTLCLTNYLVSTLEYTYQQALSTSTKLTRYRHPRTSKFDIGSAANANAVIHFFKQHGFDNTRIRNVVSLDPRILRANVENTLEPKVKVLLELGFSGPDIPASVFSVGLSNVIVPMIHALRGVMVSDDEVIHVIKKSHWHSLCSMSKYLGPNVELLRSYGVPVEMIRKRLLVKAGIGPLSSSTAALREAVVKVEEKLGIPRGSAMFYNGIHLLSSNSDRSIESKIRLFESFGWSEADVLALCRKNPFCLGLSEISIKKKLSFFMNELGLGPAYLVSYCAILTYSLEKRVMPRHEVLLVLKENGLLRRDFPVYDAVCLTESKFLVRFVRPFKEVHQLYAEYTGCTMEELIQEPS